MNVIAIGLLVGIVLLGLGCLVWRQPRAGDRIAYWHQTIAGLDEEPNRFYAQVHQALKARLDAPDMALVDLGFGPQREFETSSIFGPRPLYLGVRYRHLTFYVYAGQTPAGFFVSTWLYHRWLRGEEADVRPGKWGRMQRYTSRETMFQYDAVLMFIESVQSIVLEVLDRYIQEQGLKPLEAYERRPILHSFYRNALSGYQQGPHSHSPGYPPGPPPDLLPLQSSPRSELPYPSDHSAAPQQSAAPQHSALLHPATSDHAAVASRSGAFYSTPGELPAESSLQHGASDSTLNGAAPEPVHSSQSIHSPQPVHLRQPNHRLGDFEAANHDSEAGHDSNAGSGSLQS